jgi:glyoxylase-like metal-dependent hydrolase (beta-lactamase superfamily II)
MTYRIRALKNGECHVRDYITFHDGGEQTSLFYLYVWLIEGGPAPMLVETGVSDVEGFNRGVEAYIPGGVRQRPEERTLALLASAGVSPEQVSHIFITHFHGDHYDSFGLFPNAAMVASRQGFPGVDALAGDVAEALRQRGGDALMLVEDGEVLPGIHAFHLGVHSPCSMGLAVPTNAGVAVLPGDLIYKYENLETPRPPGWTDVNEWWKALDKIRAMGDFVLPAHDPEVLSRWPGGVIG